MSNAIDMLTLQLQYNMLRSMLQNSSSLGKSDSGDGLSSATSLSFDNLLKACLTQTETESGGFSPLSNTAALLAGVGGYGTPRVNTATAAAVQPSANLLHFVQAHEGYSSTAYRGADVQNRTIGYGHVLMPGENFNTLTQPQATQLLANDLAGPIASVQKEFSGVNLSQNQFDALVSFAYNLGDNIWKNAPKLVSDIKSGASADVLKDDFTQFVHCNGEKLQGLYNRRVDEWALFTTGYYNVNV